jgi:DNA uptake protein ComE-like DNA-binding protein
MKKPFLKQFSSGHYSGIIILFVIILLLQGYIYYANNKKSDLNYKPSNEELVWLSKQNQIDSLKEVNLEEGNKIYPFNPNFISDFKGYKLGMTKSQIDKLLNFRKQNKYVNSAQEFQQLTGVSNNWIKQYSVYFKFPDWVNNKKESFTNNYYENKFNKKEDKIIQKDLNQATQQDLEAVYMIGEKMALKILSEKAKLGAFVSLEQLNDIWGISDEAKIDLKKRFFIRQSNDIKKIKINDLSIKELQNFPYFNYYIAKNIVTYRSMNGEIKNIEDLTKIKEFPVDKIKTIALYLEF